MLIGNICCLYYCCYCIFRLALISSGIIQIGVILRDSNGIAQVKSITGNKIVRLLKKNGKSYFLYIYMLVDCYREFVSDWILF